MDKHRNNRNYFQDFYDEKKVNEKLDKKELFKGVLVCEGNKVFVKVNNEKIYINSDADCNRAFPNDNVVVEINKHNKHSGRIVYIYDPSFLKKTFKGKVVNEIKNDNIRGRNSLFFIPEDRNVPYFEVKFDTIDRRVLSTKDFKNDYESFRNLKYEAKIEEWSSRFKNPLGKLIRCLSNNSTSSNSSFENLKIELIKDESNRSIRKVSSNDNFKSNVRKPLRNAKSFNLQNKELKNSKSNQKFEKKYTFYEPYYTSDNVKKGLDNKMLFKGKLVMGDSWQGDDSFVIINDTKEKIVIKSLEDRNRGLDGDEVVFKKRNDNKTGKIIFIENPSYKNKEVNGKMLIEIEKTKNDRYTNLYLCPRDKKLPKINIPTKNAPREIFSINDYKNKPEKYRNMYNFVAKIQEWDNDDKFPIGLLIANNNSESNYGNIKKIIEEVTSKNEANPFETIKKKLGIDKKNPDDFFEKFYSSDLVEYGIKNKYLFNGKVEILKNGDCFVILNDTNEKIFIEDKKLRNRSMHDDEVVVEIINDSSDIKKGKVVYIKKNVYDDMKIPGTLEYKQERKNNILFRPDDKRIPFIEINNNSIDPKILNLNHFIKNPEEYKDNYYNAKIIKYGNHRFYPLGTLIEQIDPSTIKKLNNYYEKYLSEQEVEKGLKEGTLYEGLIRVNSKNGSDSYVTVVGMDQDIRINSVKFRNRALDNDIVIVKLLEGEEKELAEASIKEKKDENKMKDEDMYKKFATKGVKLNDYIEEKHNPLGKVVYVRNSKAKDIDIVGKFKFDPEEDYSNKEKFIFYPNDKAIPLMDILAKDIDPSVFDIKDCIANQDKYKDTLIVARIDKWSEMRCYPLGKIISKLTDEHTIESRTQIILKSHNIDESAFYDLITKEIPNDDWQIPEEELNNRLDLREECIFTIDPPTAKDLDDALSCKKLEDGNYEVGIHIADVSYFVKPDSNMDKEAYKRGTSTYLVQRVIPMLPKVLCENLCSLNAGVPRLAFSVIIKMDKNGHVLESKAGKSVICSCAKLAYSHAQKVIENENTEWPEENKDVVITNPYHPYTSDDVRERIYDLYKLSRVMKEERYANGAVSLNKRKLWFELNQDDDMPLDFGIYETREANSLVEEFMLLANTTVANMLYDTFKNESLLRCHEAPTEANVKKYLALIEMTKKLTIDTKDSKSFHDSLLAVKEAGSVYSDVALSKCIKFMKRANYICSSIDHPEALFHYGLHIPFYTHFTSPIRRYPDIIVHRQLQALLCKESSPYDSKQIHKIAKHSNDTKASAKKAQDENNNLYLIYLLHDYVKNSGEKYLVAEALTTGFDNYNIEFTIPSYAYEDKISINHLYDKGIIKGVDITKPKIEKEGEEEDNDENNYSDEIVFNIYWSNDVNFNNIIEKYEAESEANNNNIEKQKPKSETEKDKLVNAIRNSSIDSFDSVDDDEFDSDEALEQALEQNIEIDNNNDNDNEDDEELSKAKKEKIKEELKQYRKQ